MARVLGSQEERTLNRLIVGSILVLLVGIPLLTVVYLSDRWVDRGPTLAERRIQDLESAVRASPNVSGDASAIAILRCGCAACAGALLK